MIEFDSDFIYYLMVDSETIVAIRGIAINLNGILCECLNSWGNDNILHEGVNSWKGRTYEFSYKLFKLSGISI
jgi:hypothetical protein